MCSICVNKLEGFPRFSTHNAIAMASYHKLRPIQ